MTGDGMQAHHIFPQKFIDKFKALGIDINDPKYGAWVNSNEHSWFSYEYNLDWYEFLKTNPTYDAVLAFAKELAGKYGYTISF